MNPAKLWADDDAVSSVIGVILMVAITVVLAAVVTTIVLGIGEDVEEPAPTASFLFELEDAPGENVTDSWGENHTAVGANGNDLQLLKITHAGGDDIDPEKLHIMGTRSIGDLSNESVDSDSWHGDHISAGDTVVVWVEKTHRVDVIWRGEGESMRLASFSS